jgi:hypothetical protein
LETTFLDRSQSRVHQKSIAGVVISASVASAAEVAGMCGNFQLKAGVHSHLLPPSQLPACTGIRSLQDWVTDSCDLSFTSEAVESLRAFRLEVGKPRTRRWVSSLNNHRQGLSVINSLAVVASDDRAHDVISVVFSGY